MKLFDLANTDLQKKLVYLIVNIITNELVVYKTYF